MMRQAVRVSLILLEVSMQYARCVCEAIAQFLFETSLDWTTLVNHPTVKDVFCEAVTHYWVMTCHLQVLSSLTCKPVDIC